MIHTTLSSRIVTALLGIALASVALAPVASAHHGTVPRADSCPAAGCSADAQASRPLARPGSTGALGFRATPDESPHRVNWLYPAIGVALAAGIVLTLTRRRSRQARRAGIRAATS